MKADRISDSKKPILGIYDGSEPLSATTENDIVVVRRDTTKSMQGLWMFLLISAGMPLFLATGGAFRDNHFRLIQAVGTTSVVSMMVIATCCVLLFLRMRWILVNRSPAMRITSEEISIQQGTKINSLISYSDIAEVKIEKGKHGIGRGLWIDTYSLNIIKKSGELIKLFTIPNERQAELLCGEIKQKMGK